MSPPTSFLAFVQEVLEQADRTRADGLVVALRAALSSRDTETSLYLLGGLLDFSEEEDVDDDGDSNIAAAFVHAVYFVAAERCESDAGTSGNYALAGRALRMTAMKVWREGNPGQAIKWLRDAQGFYGHLLRDATPEIRAEVAFVSASLGMALAETGDVEGAVDALTYALNCYKVLVAAGAEGYRVQIAHAYLQIGITLMNADMDAASVRPLFAVASGADELRDCVAAAHSHIGWHLGRLRDFPGAVEHYRRAIEQYEGFIMAGKHAYRAPLIQARRHLGSDLISAGDLSQALVCLRSAFEECRSLPEPGNGQVTIDLLRIRAQIGMALEMQGDTAGALLECLSAFEGYEILIAGGHEQYRREMAKLMASIAIAHSKKNDMASALSWNERALAEFQRIDRGCSLDRDDLARAHSNTGKFHLEAGAPAEALGHLRAAIDGYVALIASGTEQYRFELTSVRMGVASVLSNLGDLAAAVAELQIAVRECEELLATGGDQNRARVAQLRVNLGGILLEQCDHQNAIAHFRVALEHFECLIAIGHRHFLSQAAMTRMNLGRALLLANEYPGARSWFERALVDYQSLVLGGATQHRGTIADLRRDLGTTLLQSGDAPGAISHFQAAADEYEARVASGIQYELEDLVCARIGLCQAFGHPAGFDARLQQYRAINAIWASADGTMRAKLLARQLLACNLALRTVINWGRQDSAMINDAALVHDIEELACTLRSVPVVCQNIGDKVALKALDEALDILNLLGHTGMLHPLYSPMLETMRGLARHAYAAWLVLARRLLGDGHPALLRANSSAIEANLAAALEMTLNAGMKLSDCPLLDWVMHTQGLRSQRDLLMDATDPELQELAVLWNRIDLIDRDSLGDTVRASAGLPDVEREARGMSLISEYHHRHVLVARRDELRERLAREGRLPDAGVMAQGQILQHLGAGEELWILLPRRTAEKMELYVIRVLPPAAGETQLREIAGHVPFGDSPGTDAWNSQLQQLGGLFASGSRTPVRRAPELVDPEPGPPAESTDDQRPKTIELSKTLWEATWRLSGVVRAARNDSPGLRCAHLIPLGEAHAVPWTNGLLPVLREAGIDLKMRQYPSLLAWTRARAGAAGGCATQAMRPAIVQDDARNTELSNGTSAYLPMVELEAVWSRALWERASSKPVLLPDSESRGTPWPPTVDANDSVQALIGMGHGGAPAGNWARSGLWMPGSRGRENANVFQASECYLSAAHLPGIAHAERLFMSCCVLGRTADRLGEPLGLLALAFGFRTRVAIGSLLPIDDACAMLVSLSFQWRVIAAGSTADWVEEFQELCWDLVHGRWPGGFADWLRERLSEALEFEEDPQARWLVCLLNLVDVAEQPELAPTTAEWLRQVRHELPDALAARVPRPVRACASWFVAYG